MAMGGKAGEVFTEINVTPLTDVFLVLLVIMILIAPLVYQAVLKVDPPLQGQSPPPIPDPNEVKCNVVVTKDVEPYTIVAGIPARKLGMRTSALDYSVEYRRLLH